MKIISTSSIILVFLIVSGFGGCEKEIITGLEGITYRGPINPVALEGVPNDAPFSSEFNVYDMSDKLVDSFTSDSDGKYFIELEEGEYQVVPDESSPLLMPSQQSEEVIVIENQITKRDLFFDTGIR